jgi:hypothetical protein
VERALRVGYLNFHDRRHFAQEKGVPEICTDNKQICFFVCNEASGA